MGRLRPFIINQIQTQQKESISKEGQEKKTRERKKKEKERNKEERLGGNREGYNRGRRKRGKGIQWRKEGQEERRRMWGMMDIHGERKQEERLSAF